MPMQRRLPKFGFHSAQARLTAQVRLNELAAIAQHPIDLAALIASSIVPAHSRKAKVILSGRLEKAVVLKGIAVTPRAQRVIEAAGGRIEE